MLEDRAWSTRTNRCFFGAHFPHRGPRMPPRGHGIAAGGSGSTVLRWLEGNPRSRIGPAAGLAPLIRSVDAAKIGDHQQEIAHPGVAITVQVVLVGASRVDDQQHIDRPCGVVPVKIASASVADLAHVIRVHALGKDGCGVPGGGVPQGILPARDTLEVGGIELCSDEGSRQASGNSSGNCGKPSILDVPDSPQRSKER